MPGERIDYTHWAKRFRRSGKVLYFTLLMAGLRVRPWGRLYKFFTIVLALFWSLLSGMVDM